MGLSTAPHGFLHLSLENSWSDGILHYFLVGVGAAMGLFIPFISSKTSAVSQSRACQEISITFFLFKWAVLPQERVWREQWRVVEPSGVCWGLAKRKAGLSGVIKEPSVRKEQAFMLVVKWLGSNKKNAGLDRTLFCLISSKSNRKKKKDP